jgi:uridine phosphorylase
MQLSASELILNPDRSIYHLNLHPEDLADTIITVGDPDRVAAVSKYFDQIEVRKGRREFITHTGLLNNRRLTVVSTGIGTDNIDIVLNELDALVNIDFSTRRVKQEKRALTLVRVGTSGAIQPRIPLDSFVISEFAIGFDGLLHFYKHPPSMHADIEEAFIEQMNWQEEKSRPYVLAADPGLLEQFGSVSMIRGFTGTNTGFYGPQGRRLRLEPRDTDLSGKLAGFEFKGLKITNLEMETSGIYALAALMGHRAVSMNCIVANRASGEFSKNPSTAVEALIEYTLDKLTKT